MSSTEVKQSKVKRLALTILHFDGLKNTDPSMPFSPPRTDYCDLCKELNEKINRHKTILQRLRQSGNSSDAQLRENEVLLDQAKNDLAAHKLRAQKALEHYEFTVEQCEKNWKAILELISNDTLDVAEEKELEKRQASFMLVLSADYQMTKLIPHWGNTAQPGISYYLRKYLFGIVDHRDGSKFVAVFDERVGPKNTDHTVSLLFDYLCHSGLVPSWVKRVCIFLDATSTNKNRYLLGWSMELVQHSVLDLIRVPFLITGHTKFAPDRVFSSIGSSYIHKDVFNIAEIVQVAADWFSNAFEETGVNVLHWRQELDKKYSELTGILKYHDFFVTRNSDDNAELVKSVALVIFTSLSLSYAEDQVVKCDVSQYQNVII